MKLAYIWCLLLLLESAHAQEFSSNKEYVAPSRYWGISITPSLVSKAIITGEKHDYHVKSAPQFGAEVLINYHYRFEQNYSLIFGGGLNILGYNFDYDIPKDQFDPPTTANITTNGAASREMNIIYFRVPFELERIFSIQQNNVWVVRAGGSLLFSVQQPEETSDAVYYPNGGSQNFLNRYQNNNNHGKPWVSFQLVTGHRWIFRKNSIQASLKLNYCPTKFVDGEYHFNVGSQPKQQGRYGVTGSYIGFSFEYIFTKKV